MKRRLAFAMCASAVLGLAAAAGGSPASASPQKFPPGTDPRLLAAAGKANSDFEVAMTKGDVAAIVAPYADDAIFVLPDGTCFKGRAGIERLYRERFAKSGPAVESRIESKEIHPVGDLAYEWGLGTLARRRNGKLVNARARFLTVWHRQADGGWKILRNIVLPAE
jgi:ketosteroid isomerase-like protein